MNLLSLTDQVLQGSVILAFPISIFAGVVAFLSPCVLPLVPAYLAYVTGLTGAELENPSKRKRIIAGTSLFIIGFSSVFISYGALFGGAGNQLLTRERGISQVLGVFTIIMGLLFLGVIKNTREFRPRLKTDGGLLFAPFLGVLFAIGWTPCIGPTLAAVQALAFNEESALTRCIPLPWVLHRTRFAISSRCVWHLSSSAHFETFTNSGAFDYWWRFVNSARHCTAHWFLEWN